MVENRCESCLDCEKIFTQIMKFARKTGGDNNLLSWTMLALQNIFFNHLNCAFWRSSEEFTNYTVTSYARKKTG